MTKNTVSVAAQRSRQKRAGYVIIGEKRRRWTAAETASLRLHLEILGRRWLLISQSMQRSPDSIQKHAERAFGLAWLREQADGASEVSLSLS
ncbi:MAG: hypothetical protein CL862_03305 [Cyanobium sp. NAT70]|nr:hypothetical protein [Cyanobium sp. NAT70]|tara:strand:- start:1136 stop:1411 length:276 start_codon:yes stop_codon:yes gene_type:complete